MASTRIVTFAAPACAILALVSCATPEVDNHGEQQFAEFRTSCLSARRPAYSPEHTDCVLARYRERQEQLERLRNALAPPPPAAPAVSPANAVSPMQEPGGQPWMM
jgi:hypothetical protein